VKRLVFKKLNTEAVDDLKLTYHLTSPSPTDFPVGSDTA
jgi:hypothetical protein